MSASTSGGDALLLPATLLAAMAVLWGGGLFFMTILSALGIVEGQGVSITAVGEPSHGLNLFASIFVMAYYLAIAAGAYSMPRGGSKTVAWLTAIAAVVPCCSPFVCLGMVPGIWCLVLLQRPEVSSSLQ